MMIVLVVIVGVLWLAVGATWVRLTQLAAAVTVLTNATAQLIAAHNLSMLAVKTIATADLKNLKTLGEVVGTVRADIAELVQRLEDR